MAFRFAWKLFFGLVAIVVVAGAVGWSKAHELVAAHARDDIKTQIEVQLWSLRGRAMHWLQGAGTDPQGEVQLLGHRTMARITVVREDGRVLADSEGDPARMENHAAREEFVAAAKQSEPAFAHRRSATTSADTFYAALSVRDAAGGFLGWVRVAKTTASVAARQADLQRIFGVSLLLAIGVAGALGFYFARSISRPLQTMTGFAQAVADGNDPSKLAIDSRDEIGALAKAVNSMAEQLRERLERIVNDRNELRAILSGMAEGVVAVDRNERVVHMNAVAGGILGTMPDEAFHKPIWEVTRLRQVCAALTTTLARGSVLAEEVGIQSGSEARMLELVATPLRDRNEELAGAVVVMHDVTRLRQLEVIRRDFVANVSHELKTPLTAIRGFVETLLDERGMAAEQRQRFLGKIKDHCERLTALVTDLLSLSRVESGREVLEKDLLDLRDPVRASAQGLLAAAGKKQLRLETVLAERPLPVRGDAEALRQVVDNLIANAIQYTPAGGRIEVRAHARERVACIEVEDTGIGIEPRDQERIFERFYRVDKARSRELGGTGLGLAIVKHIVLAHGGTIGVDSTPGAGSTFRVLLPLEGENPS